MKQKEFKSWIGKNPGRRKKEFNLSDEGITLDRDNHTRWWFNEDKVKEAVRLLKEEMNTLDYDGEMKTIIWIIDKIFGDKLTK